MLQLTPAVSNGSSAAVGKKHVLIATTIKALFRLYEGCMKAVLRLYEGSMKAV